MARMLAARKAGSQSCRERVVEGDVARYSSWRKALSNVMRTVRMCAISSAIGVVEMIPLILGGAIIHLYRSHTEINVVQAASRHMFYIC